MKTELYEVVLEKVENLKVCEVRGNKIKKSVDVFNLLKKVFKRSAVEKFVVVGLNSGNKVVGVNVVSVGTANESIVHPREVFKPLFLMNAVAFIVAHNHPSGAVKPSEQDDTVTSRMISCAKMFKLPLLDHIVYGGDKYFSYADEGRIDDI